MVLQLGLAVTAPLWEETLEESEKQEGQTNPPALTLCSYRIQR